MDVDGRDVPGIGRGVRSTDDQDCSDVGSAIQTVGSEEVQRKKKSHSKEMSRGEKSSRSYFKDHRINRKGIEEHRKATFGDFPSF